MWPHNSSVVEQSRSVRIGEIQLTTNANILGMWVESGVSGTSSKRIPPLLYPKSRLDPCSRMFQQRAMSCRALTAGVLNVARLCKYCAIESSETGVLAELGVLNRR